MERGLWRGFLWANLTWPQMPLSSKSNNKLRIASVGFPDVWPFRQHIECSPQGSGRVKSIMPIGRLSWQAWMSAANHKLYFKHIRPIPIGSNRCNSCTLVVYTRKGCKIEKHPVKKQSCFLIFSYMLQYFFKTCFCLKQASGDSFSWQTHRQRHSLLQDNLFLAWSLQAANCDVSLEVCFSWKLPWHHVNMILPITPGLPWHEWCILMLFGQCPIGFYNLRSFQAASSESSMWSNFE